MANSKPDHLLLASLPDQYLTKRPTTTIITEQQQLPQLQLQDLRIPLSTPSSQPQKQRSLSSTRSSSSLRKSSGSYSIYSTFGGDESIYSVESNKKERQSSSVDSFMTTAAPNNEIINHDEVEESNSTTTTTSSNDEDDDDDDDAFVDATGLSQEDIEREKLIEINNKNLSKRLSGGHFGSAGGLVLSIHPENDSNTSPPPVPPVQEQYKRKSRNNTPTDEELTKSMLNWKRHSDSSKRWSATRQHFADEKVAIEDKHASSATVIDLRSSAYALLHFNNTNSSELTHKEEEEEEGELSIPDKMALRKKAEEALSGSSTPSSIEPQQQQQQEILSPLKSSPTVTTLASLSSSSTLNEQQSPKSTISTAESFSKTLDDVWKTSESSLDLLNDPKSMELHSSIQNNENNSDKLEDKIKDTAHSLWKEDETVVSKEKMAEWLGQG